MRNCKKLLCFSVFSRIAHLGWVFGGLPAHRDSNLTAELRTQVLGTEIPTVLFCV